MPITPGPRQTTLFYYPDESVKTYEWVPSLTAVIGCKRALDTGINNEQMADGATIVGYRMVDVPFLRFQLQFKALNDADVLAFEAFMTNIQAGAFRVHTSISLGTYHTVKVAPGQRTIVWQDEGPDRWGADRLLELWQVA